MTADLVDSIFVCLHLAMVAVRVRWANRYGPASLVFLSLFDVFYAMPVYLNVLLGTPDYPSFPGLLKATTPVAITLAYDALVLALMAIFAAALVQDRRDPPAALRLGDVALKMVLLVAYFPLIYVVITGNAGLFATYGDVTFNWRLTSAGDFLVTLSTLIGLSIAACGMVIICGSTERREALRQGLMVAPAFVSDIWLMGKRSTVAYLVLLLGIRMLNRNRHGLHALHAVVGLVAAAVVLTFSLGYLLLLRPDTQTEARASYEYFRIDMGRDHDLKLALHAEMFGPALLQERMQSLIFIATLPVPRSLWPDKPYPYPVYATSAALDIPTAEIGWGITTGIFSEFLSNLGVFGFLPAIVMLVTAIRRIDLSADPIVLVIGTLAVCSLLMLHFGAIWVWPVTLAAYLIWRRAPSAWRKVR